VSLRLLGLSAVEYSRERLPLLLGSVLVNDRLHRAVAFVDRPGPRIQEGVAQAIERDATEVAPLNPTHLETMAIPIARASFELAGTAIIAIAITEGDRLYAPIDHIA
jgi:hypothetical protein